jgi:hypothetical protein
VPDRKRETRAQPAGDRCAARWALPAIVCPIDCASVPAILATVARRPLHERDGCVGSRARDWERTAHVALFVAVVTAVIEGITEPRGHPGDLLVSAYFALVSLLLYGQGVWVGTARSAAPFTPAAATVLAATAVAGIGLGLLDVATAGGI